jgi:hypothetical protein
VTIVEVRCPVGPQKLFTKLKLGEEFGKYLPGNMIEFTCGDCARSLGRKDGNRYRVYHSFNFMGELVVTKAELLFDCTTAIAGEPARE